MSGLSDIVRVEVPRRLVLDAHAHLRRMGEKRFEGFALWAGQRSGQTFRVTHTVIPAQRGTRSEQGVCVAVGPEELHKLNVWLFENTLSLIAQLHSHPGAAYHSDTDDEFPIATVAGSLSLVVPDFAKRPFSLETTAVYRLSAIGHWDELTAGEVKQLIVITE